MYTFDDINCQILDSKCLLPGDNRTKLNDTVAMALRDSSHVGKIKRGASS